MKKLLLTAIIFITASMMFAYELQIGNGTATDTHLPIEPYYGYSYSQTIYPSSDFPDSAIVITSIQYNYHKENMSDCDDWVIYFGTTSQTNLDSGYEDISQFTEVYNGNIGISQVANGDGWIEITLDTPFPYNPANGENLIIAVDENTPGWSTGSNEFYCSSATENVSRYYYNDNDNPDPTNPPTGSTSSYYPNIKFAYTFINGDIPSAPTNLTATVNELSIDLTWNNPTTTANGNPLTDLQQIVVERDGEIISTFDSPTAGEELTYTDNFIIGGQYDYTYSVYGVNEFGDGVRASIYVDWGGPSIQGLCLMSNTSNATGIKVKFTADPTTPSAVTDSTYTNINGWYGIDLNSGRYNISYTFPGYTPESIPNYFYNGDNVILEEKTIYPTANMQTISGDISGILANNTIYDVIADINVPENDSLVIGPNTSFFFREGVNFNIYGKIIAEGTAEQRIKFTNYPGENERGLMKLYAGNYDSLSVFSNCIFEMSNTHGLFLAENAHISWCKFNDNFGGGIYFGANSSHPITRELTTIEYSEVYQNSDSGFILSSSNYPDYLGYASPTITNCLIYNNGDCGIYSSYNNNCSPYVKNSSIYQNQSYGIICRDSTKVENCQIYSNSGMGIYCYENSQILNNDIYQNGSGIHSGGYSLVKGNCIYNNNYSYYSDNEILDNSILLNNTYVNDDLYIGSSNVTLKNNIVRGKSTYFGSYSPIVTHNNFQNVYISSAENIPGFLNGQNTNANGTACDPYGNISEDPLFYDEPNNNYHLIAGSPCINAGDPTMDLDPDGTVVDMGALYFDMNAESHAELQLPINTHNFLGTIAGESRSWFCSIVNSGTDSLEISSVNFDNDVFSIPTESKTEYPTSVSIAPGETYQMEVIFTPTEIGAFEGTMTINSNALNQPAAEIQLHGTGILNPDITLTMNVNEHHNVLSDFDFPINISSTDGLNILGYNLTISYDPDILTCNGINTEATLSEDWTVNVNTDTEGLIVIGGAGTTPLSGEGILGKLQFTVAAGILHNTVSYINIEDAIINEGNLSVVATYGSVIIENVVYGDINNDNMVMSYDAALVLHYSIMLDPLPVIDPRPWQDWRLIRADVSGDGNIYAYDASLILQYSLGLIDTFPAESGEKKKISTPEIYFEVTDNNINVFADDISGLYGLNLDIPISQDIEFGDLVFSPILENYLKDSFVNETDLNIALASPIPVEGSGVIFSIPYQTNKESQIEISLYVNDNDMNQTLSLPTTSTENNANHFINNVYKNYPNPFNPTTTISFSNKTKERVVIDIYNIKGQKVKTLTDDIFASGYHQIVWNGKNANENNVASGIFFYKVKIGNEFSTTKKMILLK